MRRAGVESFQAPYETDHQLAQEFKEGKIDFVIAEDSDFLAFPVPLLAKLNIDTMVGDYYDVDKNYKMLPREILDVLELDLRNTYTGTVVVWRHSTEISPKYGGYGFIEVSFLFFVPGVQILILILICPFTMNMIIVLFIPQSQSSARRTHSGSESDFKRKFFLPCRQRKAGRLQER